MSENANPSCAKEALSGFDFFWCVWKYLNTQNILCLAAVPDQINR